MSRRPLHYLAPLLGIAPIAVALTVGTATAQDGQVAEPDSFTSAFRVTITPDAVVDAMGMPAPGESGASGTFDLRLNSDTEVICYDITTRGVTPPFMSPARTATHVHEAAPTAQGPARIVFPNTTGTPGGTMRSEGCLQVPTTVGLPPDGPDAGAGFSLKEIEDDPTEYYADIHTQMFAPGALRGQFGSALPTGGVATGAGGTAAPGGLNTATTAAVVLLAGTALAGAAVAVRRRA